MTAATATKLSLRRRTILASAIALVGIAGAARAFADVAPVDLRVVDRDTGQPLRVWRHDGRLFVSGQPGARYSLRVTNRTGARVLVVMSVDGVNILTGETAGYDQRGYVFDAHEGYDISGWRKSDTEVADFAFAALSQSYAARTGRPGDVGVIGIAVFDERAAYQIPEASAGRAEPPDQWSRGAPAAPSGVPARRAAPGLAIAPEAAPAPPPLDIAPVEHAVPAPQDRSSAFASAEPQQERLGTAHGEQEWSTVDTVSFDRASPYPRYIRQIEYDTYDNLVARGVIPAYAPPEPRPRPFPSNPDSGGYVPDPPDDP